MTRDSLVERARTAVGHALYNLDNLKHAPPGKLLASHQEIDALMEIQNRMSRLIRRHPET